MVIYFEKKYHYLRFRFSLLRPQTKIWSRMLRIGVPAGAEFVLLFVYIMIVYGIIRGFGPAAQAGFGIGARVMQALFLPVVALAFAVSPGDWTKLRRAPRRSRAAIRLFRDRDCVGHDARSRVACPFRADPDDPGFFQGSARHRFRQRLSQDRLAQFRGRGNCFHDLKHFSGNRQHLAATASVR